MERFPDDIWNDAKKHVEEVLSQYAELIGRNNVNPWFAISMLRSYLKRYEQGERSRELLEAMQEAE